MIYTGYELLWLFFAYSFLGWVLETIVAGFKQRRLVNRGVINGPACVTYGVTMVIVTVYLRELQGFWLFLGCMIFATVIELITGRLIERMYHERWWDYSDIRWNLDGYICLPIAVLWGALGFVGVQWINGILAVIYRCLPTVFGRILLWLLVAVLLVDALATIIIMSGKSSRLDRWEAADAWFTKISGKLGKLIRKNVVKRIRKAYPNAKKQEVTAEKSEVFAYGCCFYKLAMLFFVGAFLGDIIETLFCRLTVGVWMSRSSVVWGPFSIVWGLGFAGATVLLYKYRERTEAFLFVAGTFLGGAFEYLCSVFTEIAFGTVFWDYSEIPFNLGGRINLLYCFFWGIVAVIWFKKVYPKISALIEKIPMRVGKITTWLLMIFIVCNVLVSCMALMRYDERGRGIGASESWQQTMDERFPDERMERIYPNAKMVE